MAQGQRRYKVSENLQYDHIFDLRKFESPILNPEKVTARDITSYGTVQAMNSRSGLEQLLKEWQEKLTVAKTGIDQITNQFTRYNQRKVNIGLQPLKGLPEDMKANMLKVEAIHDVIIAEISKLEERLKTLTEKEKDVKRIKCLSRGPEGSGRTRNGILVEIDGQEVAQDKECVLRIKDDQSPYNGMIVADYRERISMPWRKAKEQLMEEIRKKALQMKREGLDINMLPLNPRPPLPEWPEDIEKYNWDGK